MRSSRPTSEQSSRLTKSSDAYGSYSACCASRKPNTFRAYSMMMCWHPPHVPKQGTPVSRAWRITASVFSRLWYGLPGATQMPSNSPMALIVMSPVATHSASTSAPSAAALCAQASCVAGWGGNVGLYSPRKAILVVMIKLRQTGWGAFHYSRIGSLIREHKQYSDDRVHRRPAVRGPTRVRPNGLWLD